MQNSLIFDTLRTIVGEHNCLPGNCPDARPYLEEWRGNYQGKTPLILFPQNTQQVSKVMRVCEKTRTTITPQGGNTGLVGGQIPQGEILLSLKKMNTLRDINRANLCITVEAGMTLANLQEIAQREGLFFPLTLASEGQAQIGGLISTNAGGSHVIRFGMMRDLVLGLEVVLPDGKIWQGMTILRKDNTGYDLKQVFIGAEGTLGLVTAASLKLFYPPHERIIAWVGLKTIPDILRLLSLCQRDFPDALYAFEMLPQKGLDLVLKHIPITQPPLKQCTSWHVLLEFGFDKETSGRNAVEVFLSKSLDTCLIDQAILAENLQQQKALFRLRESLSEAQKKEGASLKHDITIPTEKLPEFIEKANTLSKQLIPGARPLPFGHAGDGNLHFNILQPEKMDPKTFLGFRSLFNQKLHNLVHQFGGSIAAEHGIGILKKTELARLKPKQDLEIMKSIKKSFDPHNIMNPRILF